MDQPGHLSSLTNPRVKAVVRLRQGRSRRDRGLFIAEGSRQIGRACKAKLCMRELYWCPELLGDDSALVEQLCQTAHDQETAPGLFTVAPDVFAKMAYRQHAEGVLAVFAQRQWELEAVLSPADTGPGLWLVAVGIEKPGNLGAMARSVAAAGGAGILLADAVVDPMHPNALEASTGAVLDLPIVATDTANLITALHKHQIQIIATSPPAPGSCSLVSAGEVGSSGDRRHQVVRSYLEVDLTGPVAIVIGPEHVGLDERWLGSCAAMDQVVSIPMPGGSVDSLNAAAAAAVLLFEAVRQRGLTCHRPDPC